MPTKIVILNKFELYRQLSFGADLVIVITLFIVTIAVFMVLVKRPQTPYRLQFLMVSLFLITYSFISALTLFADIWWVEGVLLVLKVAAVCAATGTIIAMLRLRWKLATVVSLPSPEALNALNLELEKEIDIHREESAKLAKAEQQFRTFLKHAPDGIVIINSSGVILYLNDMAELMYQYEHKELLGKSVVVLIPERLLHYTERLDVEGIDTEATLARLEKKDWAALRKDGTEFPSEIGLSGFTLDGDDVVLMTVRDISERKSLEEKMRKDSTQLAHLSRVSSVGQMAAGLAHELNQPLTAISNNTYTANQLVERFPMKEPLLKATIQESYESAQHAGRIIRSLRQLIKKTDGTRQATDLNELVSTTVDFLMPEAKAGNVKINLDLGADLQQLMIDPVQTKQVILNLGLNAVEALKSATSNQQPKAISISTRLDDEYVIVTVADNGPGLSAEMQANLFQPYISSKETGMGLGLSICKTFVESQGGTLHHRETKNGGATFYFQLKVQ